MKQLLLFAGIFFSICAQAQVKEGKIIYERVTQTPARMFANLDPHIAAQIPKSRTDQFELLFGNNQSLWQFIPSAANEEQSTFSGNGMIVRMATGNNEIAYFDFEKGVRVDQREVMEKTFIVTDTIRKGSWKLTDETKTILNYTVRKAIGQRISTRTSMTMETP